MEELGGDSFVWVEELGGDSFLWVEELGRDSFLWVEELGRDSFLWLETLGRDSFFLGNSCIALAIGMNTGFRDPFLGVELKELCRVGMEELDRDPLVWVEELGRDSFLWVEGLWSGFWDLFPSYLATHLRGMGDSCNELTWPSSSTSSGIPEIIMRNSNHVEVTPITTLVVLYLGTNVPCYHPFKDMQLVVASITSRMLKSATDNFRLAWKMWCPGFWRKFTYICF